MGVYIKGMDMPKCCDGCNMYDDNCIVSNKPYCILSGRSASITFNSLKEKMDACPLVEIPKHGRLIDADALIDGRVSNDNVRICAENAPTVLEAEG